MIDTTGEIRWFMDASSIYDINSIWNAGCFMGFRQNDDGQISFGYGQRYAKIDLMGRTIFNRILPDNYNDFSHSMDNSPNGNYFLRVASSNYKFPNSDKHVRTVRDVIAEVNPATGNVVDEWRLFDILDPYRDTVLKALDQGLSVSTLMPQKQEKQCLPKTLPKSIPLEHSGNRAGTQLGACELRRS